MSRIREARNEVSGHLPSAGAGEDRKFESQIRRFYSGPSRASGLTSLCLAFFPCETRLMTSQSVGLL